MGSVTMCCGHEAVGDEWMQGWYWKDWDGEIVYGCLCAKCVPVYRAIQTKNFGEAKKSLENSDPVTLQDICANMEGATRRTEIIGGISWDIVEIPPTNAVNNKGV